jgi:hypothetical protein
LWLIFAYSLPSSPSTKRVQVWRRLRRLGATALHDSMYVVPATARTREQLQWLLAEVEEIGGEASLWEAEPLPPSRGESLRGRFVDRMAAPYARIAASAGALRGQLESGGAVEDVMAGQRAYAALSHEYLAVRSIDYFNSPAGAEARMALDLCSAALREAADRLHAQGASR